MFKTPQESQAYLAAIVASSDDAIISKDLNGTITSWNAAAERIFGYSESEAIGKHISLIIPPDRLHEEDYIIGNIRKGVRLEHFEAVRRAKNGDALTLSVTVSPIRNEQGEIIGASKVARDLTQQRKQERAAAYLGAIIESSDDAIISKDLNGFVTSWNRSAERIFGYKPEEIVGRHITMLIPQERIDEEETILTTLKSGQRVDHFETWRRHKDGHMVPVSLSVSPILDGKGQIIGASKVSRDISERLEAEKMIQEGVRKKEEFLANMSHELRTPMNAVIGLANLLSMSDIPENTRQFVETLKISADNLMELINDLLDFAKLESGSVELEQVPFNLAHEVEKAISVSNVKAQEKGLKLYVHYAPRLRRQFLGDPLRVHQVVMNLLSNAVKFTQVGTVEVDINGKETPTLGMTEVTIKVSDTGVGIAAGKLDHIFEKFTQADSSITRRYGGSGLGLSISKGLVEKMGGTIRVESELGVGTTFYVTIPLAHGELEDAVPSAVLLQTKQEQPQRRNVLLVEDYQPNVLVATAMLDKFGYDYDVAQNGFEALRRFAQGQYDVILMDLQMHDLDGLEATRRIRRIEKEKNLERTPIVALTAHVRDQDKDKCLDAGMDDFVPKPFDPALLGKVLQRYTRLQRELAELKKA